MAEKSPAYQFYPKDILTDGKYLMMSWEQRGIYRHLIDLQWLGGSLPENPVDIAKMIAYPEKEFLVSIWQNLEEAFPLNNGKRMNPKLELIRKKLNSFKKNQSKSGKEGALRRWGRHSDPISESIAPLAINSPMAENSSSVFSLQSSFPDIKESLKEKPDSFLNFDEEQIGKIKTAIAVALDHDKNSEANRVSFNELRKKVESYVFKNKVPPDKQFNYAITSARNLGRPINLPPEEALEGVGIPEQYRKELAEKYGIKIKNPEKSFT